MSQKKNKGLFTIYFEDYTYSLAQNKKETIEEFKVRLQKNLDDKNIDISII